MPIFLPTDIVLVTGANGHVASHLVKQLLEIPDGPKVRATVRSESSAAAVRDVFSSSLSSGRLAVVFVSDLVAPGAFDSVIEDVTHVAHVASPLIVTADDLDRDLFQPAVRGTVALLEAGAKQKSKTLQRVAITGSFAAIFDPTKGWPQKDSVYSSKDWSPMTRELGIKTDEAGKRGEELPGFQRYTGFGAYLTSKKLSERAAWDFYDKGRKDGSIEWTLSVLNPNYIGGPCVIPPQKQRDGSFKGLSYSQQLILRIASGEKVQEDFPYWVDVRDVARAHIHALHSNEAQGQRFILTPGKCDYSDLSAAVKNSSSKWTPRTDYEKLDFYKIDNQSTHDVLGVRHWVSIDKMVGDLLEQVSSL